MMMDKEKTQNNKTLPGTQMRFTTDELELLRNTFKDNEPLLKVLRKVFLPEIDPYAPLGQMVDLWMADPYEQMPPDEVKIAVMARRRLITHIEGNIMQLHLLANKKAETPEERAEREKKDSSR